MMDQLATRRDRIAGFVLLALAIAVLLVPRFEIGGQPIRQSLVGFAWLGAAILLLGANAAARPSARLTRIGAAILFVMGLIGPFLANLIDQSLGA